nr:MAG TPA: Thaumarchaeal output domain 1 [Caudoviricetes sp.]
MALITCTECGKEFSDKAAACPNCGCPTEYVIQETKEKQKSESGKCPFCGSESIDEDGYCNDCGQKMPVAAKPKIQEKIETGCPYCHSSNYELIKPTQGKVARKAVVGSIVGSMLLGPVNSMVVPFTESIAKPKKLKYKCHNCSRVWEQKI